MGQNGLCCKPNKDIIYVENTTERKLSIEVQSNQNSTSPQFQSPKSNGISLIDVSVINKHIKGYLIRKSFNTQLRSSLREYSNELVSEYINQIANSDLVSQINNSTIKETYMALGWKEFYEDNPTTTTTPNTTPSQLFKTIHIEYSKETSIKKSNQTLSNALWLYQGTMDINGNYQGYGVKTFKNGSKEIGHWNTNVFEGWNTTITDKGLLFIGLFSKGVLQGKGIRYSITNSTLYKGDLVNGLREGKGIETSNTCTYNGEYVNDVKCGMGLLTFNSGDSYEGQFENNYFNGKGHYIWIKNGKEYIGEYKEGKFHGQGYYKISDNEYFKGNYVNGIKEGQGEMKYADGKKYVCSFVKGKPQGNGIFENREGKRINVKFVDGKITKERRNENST